MSEIGPTHLRESPSGGSPVVSVVVPTHDRPGRLRQAVASVLAQTFADFEIVVVDDGSTESAEEVLRELGDPRIRVFRHDRPEGAPRARNAGIRAARAEYLAFLDDDDEWLPQKLERQLAAFAAAPPEVGVVYTGFEVVSDKTGRVASRAIPRLPSSPYVRFLRSTVFSTSVPLLRMECLRKVGLFDEALPGTQDRDLWLRIARHFAFVGVPEVLVRLHIHGAQLSTDLKSKIEAKERILEKYRQDLEQNPRILAFHLRRLGLLHCADGSPVQGRRYLRESLRAAGFSRTAALHLVGSHAAPAVHRRWLLRYAFHPVDGISLYY